MGYHHRRGQTLKGDNLYLIYVSISDNYSHHPHNRTFNVRTISFNQLKYLLPIDIFTRLTIELGRLTTDK